MVGYSIEAVRHLADRWYSDVATADRLLPAHCIMAARVLTRLWPDTLEPFAVNAFYANRIAEFTRWDTKDPAVWTIAVHENVDVGGGRGNGAHVVVTDGTYLIDLSARQFDRPEHGIRVRRPVIVALDSGEPSPLNDNRPKAFGETAEAVWRRWDLAEVGVGIGFAHYAPARRGGWWRRSPNWQHSWRPFVDDARRVLDSLEVPVE